VAELEIRYIPEQFEVLEAPDEIVLTIPLLIGAAGRSIQLNGDPGVLGTTISIGVPNSVEYRIVGYGDEGLFSIHCKKIKEPQ
jgi:hypothetical protein